MVPKSIVSFDPHKELSRQKITVLEDSALVYCNFSKTNQFMNRETIIPLCQHNTTGLNPTFHHRKLYEFDIPANYPAFSYLENGRIKCVTYTDWHV